MTEIDTKVRYPDVLVPLSDEDGNAFFIISRVGAALRKARVPSADIDAFRKEAMSGDYDNVLQTVMRWVSVS